jgi:16S rRNA (adenine1518-N6/adenine1519-N6)-dimethyltransferase
LDRRTKPAVTGIDEDKLFDIIRSTFVQRRKTLLNSLSNATKLGVTKDEIRSAIAQLGWDENIRGEKLTLEQFAELTRVLEGK